MAEYYSLENKEQTTFRIDKNLYADLSNYADIKGLHKAEAINEILFKFFKGTTLTNTYLMNRGGLYFKIPLDLETKKEFIKNKTKLNDDATTNIIGNDATSVKIKKIPNNLDVFIDNEPVGSYKSTKDGILHSGIDFIFIADVLKKPKTTPKNKLDITLTDSLYIFYFEVKADNTTDVYLINPIEAINKLSDVNNRIVGDKLAEIVAILEDTQQTTNYEYKATMENLYKNNDYVSRKKEIEVLNTSWLYIEMFLKENRVIKRFNGDNILISPSSPE